MGHILAFRSLPRRFLARNMSQAMTNRFHDIETITTEDQKDFDRWSGEGGVHRPPRAAVIETTSRTHKAAPSLEVHATTPSASGPRPASIAGDLAFVSGKTAARSPPLKTLGPMRLLCFAGLHAWPRVHGTWREIVVSPSTSACRRCLKPITSLWRSQYPSDGSRCGRECSSHAAPSRKVTV